MRRFLPYSFQTPLPLEQQSRAERALAVGRAILAISGLAAISLAPPDPDQYLYLAYPLLVGYAVFALAAMVLLRLRPQHSRFWPLAMHVVDVSVAAAVTLLTRGPSSPFFVFFFFTLLSAAYRWGLVE